MDVTTAAFLFAAGTIGGAANAVAGGGTLFTFPAMLAVGIPPVAASASSYVAIWPGHAMAIPAYRHELARHKDALAIYGVVALIGGVIGAAVLLWSGDKLFAQLIPWLILLATGLFAISPYVPRWFGGPAPAAGRSVAVVAFLLMSIYGGYFGAGLGGCCWRASSRSASTRFRKPTRSRTCWPPSSRRWSSSSSSGRG